jgi:PTH2 family peptidyl-tRNA hydrolase
MKMAIVVRKDLKMSCGKIAGQVAHAAIRTYWDAEEYDPKNKVGDWVHKNNEIKVVLKVNSEEELLNVKQKCIDSGVPWAIVHDAGKTQIEPNTLTSIGIGPDEDDVIDEIVGDLKLL